MFGENWKKLSNAHTAIFNLLFFFIETTWLSHKEHFVAAWKSEWVHFVNVCPSQLEIQHNINKCIFQHPSKTYMMFIKKLIISKIVWKKVWRTTKCWTHHNQFQISARILLLWWYTKHVGICIQNTVFTQRESSQFELVKRSTTARKT